MAEQVGARRSDSAVGVGYKSRRELMAHKRVPQLLHRRTTCSPTTVKLVSQYKRLAAHEPVTCAWSSVEAALIRKPTTYAAQNCRRSNNTYSDRWLAACQSVYRYNPCSRT